MKALDEYIVMAARRMPSGTVEILCSFESWDLTNLNKET